MEKTYNFGEQREEWHGKIEKNLPVYISPKYKEGKKKAIELISSGKYDLTEADFWILKTFSAKNCIYAGLIISHNGCLKINDKLEDGLKFVPSCVSWVRNGIGDLVLQYLNDKQGIFEFGEASVKNCQNAYPFAMVLKRLQDRVILKNSKVAFSGIMSEVESDEFKQPVQEEKEDRITEEQKQTLIELGCDLERVAAAYKVDDISQMSREQADKAISIKRGRK